MSLTPEPETQADLPTVTHSADINLCGYKLRVHVLSNGERVYELNDELKRMLQDLSGKELEEA